MSSNNKIGPVLGAGVRCIRECSELLELPHTNLSDVEKNCSKGLEKLIKICVPCFFT